MSEKTRFVVLLALLAASIVLLLFANSTASSVLFG
jgi:hypothetical protein